MRDTYQSDTAGSQLLALHRVCVKPGRAVVEPLDIKLKLKSISNSIQIQQKPTARCESHKPKSLPDGTSTQKFNTSHSLCVAK